jgi:gliding motility-associated-like protein
MKKILLVLLAVFLFSEIAFAQGADCASADPFCSGSTSTFPASTSTTADPGPNYDCLGSQPNPAWYYLQVDNSGPITITMSNSASVDIDFICWGPFTSAAAGCASGLTGSAVDCSYSTAATETCNIPSALTGEVYILLITNFSGMPTNISASQTGGTGSTNCSILCSMTALTAVTGTCDPATNTYSLTGTISYTDPPATGTLTVTNSCSGASQVFNAPFPATSTSYSLNGLPANGAGCSVTAVFSADPACTLTTSFTAPPSCTLTCAISSVTANPGACDPTTLQYSESGSVTFVNPPSTGTLTITNSCGGSPVVLSAPFTSPAAYSFTGLPSNGATCSVTATFSASPSCTFTQTYTAPPSCAITCNISAISASPTACNSTTQQYSVSGNVTFVNAPSTGSLTITNSCGGSPVVLSAPFTSPANYNFTGLSANGASCTITAVFSADATCTFSQNYSAPPPCLTPCSISSVTANPSACDPATDTYSLSGTVSFTNQPATGTLIISNSCGSSQTFNAPFTSPLSYSFSGLDSDGSGCIITALFSADSSCTLSQSYSAPPSCSACPVTAGNNGPICSGDSLFLNASTVAGASYSWTGPGGFTSNLQNPVIPNATLTATGDYEVTITTTSPACTSNSTTTFSLLPGPVPSVSGDVTIYLGQSALLIASGGSSYTWSPALNLSCTVCDSTIATPTETSTYCVSVTDLGCTDSACVTVNIHVPCRTDSDLETPNAFTPNNDSYNDEFCLYGWGECVSEFSIFIFDRWGAKIFESTDPGFCWNGYYKGRLLDPGVYVYFIKAAYIIEGATANDPTTVKEITKKGNISLIR